jgi:hypothetical protein
MKRTNELGEEQMRERPKENVLMDSAVPESSRRKMNRRMHADEMLVE